ncbi:uncharacterized protein LOC108250925 [Kryptolebias marmoratus]|uniref:uncharacterized protein LOC108250925 n=1 Tax=Kryptolebias marmoratus TaxID=37003 RepID=UPI0007F87CBD|nr:uncharacterized protein LOC108250925 [Kryptolebias marmoratus]
MKLPFRLCFLVLVMSSVSWGDPTEPPGTNQPETDFPPVVFQDLGNNKTAPAENKDSNRTTAETKLAEVTQQTLNKTGTAPTPTPTNQTTPAPTPQPEGDKGSTESGSSDEGSEGTTSVSSTPAVAVSSSAKAGYVVLVLIVIIIIILCVILFMLRRASRTYSFDLQRPSSPSRHLDEPTGTFGQVYVDDLDRPAPKDIPMTEDITAAPVANGTSPEPEEKGSSDETAVPQEQPEAIDVPKSPSSSFTSSLDEDKTEKLSVKLSSNNLFFDAAEEPQNENNNHPLAGSSYPFVEINLDEPAWCDELLASQPSSSVCPFSSSSSS